MMDAYKSLLIKNGFGYLAMFIYHVHGHQNKQDPVVGGSTEQDNHISSALSTLLSEKRRGI